MELARELWLALPEFGQGKAIKWGRKQSKMSPGMAVLSRTGQVTLHQKWIVWEGGQS